MAPVTTFPLGSLLVTEKLLASGDNFVAWFRNINNVLKNNGMDYVLMQPLGELHDNATEDETYVHQSKSDAQITVQCGMLASMDSELQKRFEDRTPYHMVQELKLAFQKQISEERFKLSKTLFNRKMPEGGSVTQHVLRLSVCAKELEILGYPVHQQLYIDLVLSSLPPSFDNFVKACHVDEKCWSMDDLFEMLKKVSIELSMKKTGKELPVKKTTNFKKKGKKKNKSKGITKTGAP